jgi:hypothetical protein
MIMINNFVFISLTSDQDGRQFDLPNAHSFLVKRIWRDGAESKNLGVYYIVIIVIITTTMIIVIMTMIWM